MLAVIGRFELCVAKQAKLWGFVVYVRLDQPSPRGCWVSRKHFDLCHQHGP